MDIQYEWGRGDLRIPQRHVNLNGHFNRHTLERRIMALQNGLIHRWARLLKQRSSITVYCLPTMKNKCPLSDSVGRKRAEVCHLRFPFAEKTQVAVFHWFRFPFAEFWKHREMDMGDMETWRHGDMETQRHDDM